MSRACFPEEGISTLPLSRVLWLILFSGKQCRERWSEYLNPTIDVSDFTSIEDELILQAQNNIGNKWRVYLCIGCFAFSHG